MNNCHDPKTGRFCSGAGARAARKWKGGATKAAQKLMERNRHLSNVQAKHGPNKLAQRIQSRNATKIRSLVDTYGAKV